MEKYFENILSVSPELNVVFISNDLNYMDLAKELKEKYYINTYFEDSQFISLTHIKSLESDIFIVDYEKGISENIIMDLYGIAPSAVFIVLYDEVESTVFNKLSRFISVSWEKKPIEIKFILDRIKLIHNVKVKLKQKYDQDAENYRNLIKNLNEVFYEIDFKGNILYVNPAVISNLAYSPEDIIGKNITEFLDSENATTLMQYIKDIASFKSIKRINLKIKNADGLDVPFVTAGGKLIYQDGYPHSITGILTNVSKLKEAEIEIIAQKRNFETIVKAIPDLIFRIKRNGTIVEFHAPESFKLLVPEEAFIGQDFKQLPFNEADLKKMIVAFENSFNGNSYSSVAYSLIIEGEERFYEARYIAIDSNECLCLVRDISVEKLFNKALQESEKNYGDLVENAQSIIMKINKYGELSFINKFGSEFFSYSYEELQNKDIFSILFSNEDSTKLEINLDRIVKNPDLFYNIETENLKKDGSIAWISWVNKLIYDDKGEFQELLSIGIDRTKQKYAQDKVILGSTQYAKFQGILNEVINYSNFDLETTLRRIIQQTTQAIGATKASLWISDDKDEFTIPKWIYSVEGNEFNLIPNSKLELSEVRKLIERNTSFTFTEFSENQKLWSWIESTHGSDTASILGVGIIVAGKLRGTVIFSICTNCKNWTLQEVEFANSIAGTIALRLEFNDRQKAESKLEKRLEQTKHFRDCLTKLFSIRSNNTEQNLQEILVLAAKSLNINRISIWDINYIDNKIICKLFYEESKSLFSRGEILDKALFENYFNLFYQNRIISIENVYNEPKLANLIDYFNKFSITATLDTLIRLPNNSDGVLCIEHTAGSRDWTIEEEEFAIAVSERISFEFESQERKIADRKRIDSEIKFKQFVENANDVIFTISPDGYFTYMSPNMYRKTGYSPEEMIGKLYTDFIHPDDIPSNVEFVKKLKSPKNIVNDYIIYRTRHKAGNWIWFRSSGACIFNSTGEPEFLLGIATNITDIIHAEDTLNKNRQMLQNIFDSVNVGIMIINQNTIIEQINEQGAKILEQDVEDMIGKSLRAYIPIYLPELFPNNNDDSSDFKSITREIKFRTKSNKQINLEMSTNYFSYGDSSNHVLAVFTDITEKRTAAEQLKIALDQAEAANKLKSEFLANFSHEIRTPLNSIIGFAQLLLDTKPDDRQTNYINSIRNSGKTLLDIINDIIDLSKIEAGKLVPNTLPINLFDLSKDLFDSCAPLAAQKSLQFEFFVDERLPLDILIDEKLLSQIIINLADNAIKFTNYGSINISFKAGKIDFDSNTLDLNLIVADTGEGISEEMKPDLFKPFIKSRTSKNFSGIGTGLALIHKLTELLNGSIHFETKESQGTVFTISFKNIKFNNEIKNYNLANISNYWNTKPNIVMLSLSTKHPVLESVANQLKAFLIYTKNKHQFLELINSKSPILIIIDGKLANDTILLQTLKFGEKPIKMPLLGLSSANIQEKKYYDVIIEDKNEMQLLEIFKQLIVQSETIQSKYIKYNLKLDDVLEESDVSSSCAINELIDNLDLILKPEWEQVSKQMIISNIKSFAKKVETLGSNFEQLNVKQFGEKLFNQCNNFELDKIQKTLSLYPDLINNLKLYKNK